MPLYYQQNINETTKMAVWKIEETAEFFLEKVPLRQQITHPHKQLQHLAGRYLLRYLYPDFPTQLIQIADTRKPFLPEDQYHFSISHCGNYAAAIVSSKYRVGIDAEIFTPRVLRIAHKFLHEEELADWRINARPNVPFGTGEALANSASIQTLTLLWSCKEALFKWWGRGDVDFSEVMRVSANELQEHGSLKGSFTKKDFHQELLLNYRLQDELSLVWVFSE